MTMWRTGVFAVVFALSAGCAQHSGSGEGDEDNNEGQQQQESSGNNVFSGQTKTIDKAKGVEQTLMNSAQVQNGEIEKQSQ